MVPLGLEPRAGAGWKARKHSEWWRSVLHSRRRLTVAKMLHERLGDEAIWLEAEVLEIIIQLIPSAGLVISVGSGAHDCRTIAAGLDAAQPGDTVKLAPGVYREPIVLQPSPSGVTVRGMGATPGDVVVEWGDEPAADAGVTALHVAGTEVVRAAGRPRGSSRWEQKATQVAIAACAVLAQQAEPEPEPELEPQMPASKGEFYSADGRDTLKARLCELQKLHRNVEDWNKWCAPLRCHGSGCTVSNLTLRGINSPAVFADSGGLRLEDVVCEGQVQLETHTTLVNCAIQGVHFGPGVSIHAPSCTVRLLNCKISDCLVGVGADVESVTRNVSSRRTRCITISGGEIVGCEGAALRFTSDIIETGENYTMGGEDRIINLDTAPVSGEVLWDPTFVVQGGVVFSCCGRLRPGATKESAARLAAMVGAIPKYDDALATLIYHCVRAGHVV